MAGHGNTASIASPMMPITHGDQEQRQEAVKVELDQEVPARMQEGGEQNGQEDMKIHLVLRPPGPRRARPESATAVLYN